MQVPVHLINHYEYQCLKALPKACNISHCSLVFTILSNPEGLRCSDACHGDGEPLLVFG